MIIRRKDLPTVFLVATNEGQCVIVDNHGFAHNREDVAELIEAAQSHLNVYPTNQSVRDDNIRHDEYLRNREKDREKEQRQVGPKKSREGFVYLCLNNRNGLVKIGFSTNPRQREQTLQSEEPEIEFIHVFQGTREDEEKLHARYAYARKRGEWFELAWHEIQAIMGKSE